MLMLKISLRNELEQKSTSYASEVDDKMTE